MEKIKKFLFAGPIGTYKPEDIFRAVQDLFTRQVIVPGLLVSSAAVTFATTNAIQYLINGVLYTKAALSAIAVPTATAWSAVASTFNAAGFLVTLDAAGNVATIPTNVVSSLVSANNALAGIVWPTVPDNVVVVGGFVVYTTAANTAFTPGTTNLIGAANIGTITINTTGPFYPVTPV